MIKRDKLVIINLNSQVKALKHELIRRDITIKWLRQKLKELEKEKIDLIG